MGSSSSTPQRASRHVRPGPDDPQRPDGRALAVTGSAIGVLALLAGHFVVFRPNRIAEGAGVTALQGLGALAWTALALWVATGALAFRSPGRFGGVIRALTATAAFSVGLVGAGRAALVYAHDHGAVARTSLGISFYLTLLGLVLVLHHAEAITLPPLGRAFVFALPFAAVGALIASGSLGELAFAREWLFVRTVFARELQRHLLYAVGVTAVAVVLGVPLGVLSARRRRAESVIMGVLGLGQVFPALAFIGLVMPLLGGLGRSVPALGALGVSGVGWAPVLLVLLVYALFPIARNTCAAIRALDPAVVDSAVGMGMGRGHLFFGVELPLAFPVVLAGVRVALVQTTGGAILAAFVGGGGLGTVMFAGLEQASIDLVLLGVVPIVALALVFDTALRGAERLYPATGGVSA